MKKLYTILTLALGGAFCVPAANAAITSIDQLVGTYNAVYAWGFTDNNGQPDGEPDFLINPTISLGNEANEILLEGLFPTVGNDFAMNASLPIKGTVDLSNQTVIFPANQVLGEDSYGTNTLAFMYYNINRDEWEETNAAVANITANGDIAFPTEYAIACASTAGGSWYLYYTLTLQPFGGDYPYTAAHFNGEYDASFEWYAEDANGQYIDSPGIKINPVIVADDDDAYELEITNLFTFLNPQLEIEGEVMPSGSIRIDNVQMFDLGARAYQLIIFDENFILPDYILVHQDLQGNLVFPDNILFGMGVYSGYTYQFQALYGFENLVFNKTAGIGSMVDDLNAPIKYFDLKGNKVNNPMPGQLLIKKQGNKASKVIVK